MFSHSDTPPFFKTTPNAAESSLAEATIGAGTNTINWLPVQSNVERSEKIIVQSSGSTPTAAVVAVGATASQLSKQVAFVQHTVHDLEPLTRYLMRVLAVNSVDKSQPSAVLSVRTEEEGELCVYSNLIASLNTIFVRTNGMLLFAGFSHSQQLAQRRLEQQAALGDKRVQCV